MPTYSESKDGLPLKYTNAIDELAEKLKRAGPMEQISRPFGSCEINTYTYPVTLAASVYLEAGYVSSAEDIKGQTVSATLHIHVASEPTVKEIAEVIHERVIDLWPLLLTIPDLEVRPFAIRLIEGGIGSSSQTIGKPFLGNSVKNILINFIPKNPV